jgi:hypothetical protein
MDIEGSPDQEAEDPGKSDWVCSKNGTSEDWVESECVERKVSLVVMRATGRRTGDI